MRADAKLQFYAVPSADLHDLMDERTLVLTGVSHEYSEIYGATVEAYVTPPQSRIPEIYLRTA